MITKPANVQYIHHGLGEILIGSLISLALLVSGCSSIDDGASEVPSSNGVEATSTYTPLSTKTSIPLAPRLGIGSTMISRKDSMNLLYVPAGKFTMGNETYDNEKIHTVYLDAFWIDQFEVTNKMYSLCVAAGICDEPVDKRSFTRSSYYGNSVYDNYPVVYIDWNMAKTYCEWADRRLPTEAEWEKAARGPDANIYPWGNDTPNSNLLNYDDAATDELLNDRAAFDDTTEVGKYPDGAGLYGALDMTGNVWEWAVDWYSDTYYVSSPDSNPLGPVSGEYRVIRGGYYGNILPSSFRTAMTPDFTFKDSIGFRCAMSVTP
jgi:formylglycine-generating enzyme required for sulfatase activity